jgi:creatinine amidohydrolase/Fe(II)-dependent formamide hydrolase-like protein
VPAEEFAMATRALALLFTVVFVSSAFAQGGGGRGGQRPPLTPEQQAEQKRREADTAVADGVRPIDMLNSVWMEELSWMEVRDQMKAGKTMALLGTGGVEKNGPYTATGKHNYVLQTTLEAIARKHGQALVAPLITWEPCNPDRENLTPGTFCVTQDTYKALLRDAITSLKSMGIKDIVMVADSGGNPPAMIEVMNELNAKWKGSPARVFYIPEYYDEDRWSYDYMKKTLGITQVPDVQSATRWDIHDDYHYEALVAVQDPKLVHAEQRIKAKKFSIYGVEIGTVAKLVENGKKLADYRATITINAIKKAQAAFKVP